MSVAAETVRTDRIRQELDALTTSTDVERIRLPWQGTTQAFSVIRLPLDCVVLNPRSHRVRAQLESNPNRDLVAEDPFSEQAQATLAILLEETDEFDDLKANLGDVGQREPGVITRAGLLVNGNTRAVALAQVDPHDFIRVAVLPEGADPKSIARLELELQMKREFKQDYTFTNQLLFVEDLKQELGYNDEDVAKAMNLAASSDEKELRRGAKQAAQFTRVLAMIRDLQRRSDGRMPLDYFDARKQALTEIDKAYEDLRLKNPSEATRMREARYLAVLIGAGYREMRNWTPENVDGYLTPALKENPEIGEDLTAVLEADVGQEELPGLDALEAGPADTADGANLAGLVDIVASSFGMDTVEMPSANGDVKQIDRDDLDRNLTESIGDAIDEARRADTKAQGLDAPVRLLEEAQHRVTRTFDAYRKLATHPEFDTEEMETRIRKLKNSLDALEAEISSSTD